MIVLVIVVSGHGIVEVGPVVEYLGVVVVCGVGLEVQNVLREGETVILVTEFTAQRSKTNCKAKNSCTGKKYQAF